jgi:hypothetical protein
VDLAIYLSLYLCACITHVYVYVFLYVWSSCICYVCVYTYVFVYIHVCIVMHTYAHIQTHAHQPKSWQDFEADHLMSMCTHHPCIYAYTYNTRVRTQPTRARTHKHAIFHLTQKFRLTGIAFVRVCTHAHA